MIEYHDMTQFNYISFLYDHILENADLISILLLNYILSSTVIHYHDISTLHGKLMKITSVVTILLTT